MDPNDIKALTGVFLFIILNIITGISIRFDDENGNDFTGIMAIISLIIMTIFSFCFVLWMIKNYILG